jgi:hypothetical protein
MGHRQNYANGPKGRNPRARAAAWPDWLTMSVHEAKAEVLFERPEVCR